MERDSNVSAVEDFKCFNDTVATIQGFASSTLPPDGVRLGVSSKRSSKRRLCSDVTTVLPQGCMSRDESTQTESIRPKVLSTHLEFWSIEPSDSSENMVVDEDEGNDVDDQDSCEYISSDDEGLSDFSDQENHKINAHSIVRKRHANKDSPYVPCPYCKATYAKGSLQRHYRNCPRTLRAPKTSIREASSHKQQSAPTDASDKSRQTVLPPMLDDETLKIIKSSPELIKYANDLCDRYATKKLFTNLIRTRLRLLGSLLLECKAVDKTILGLTDIFNVTKLESIFTGVQRICGCDDYASTGKVESPTTVKALRTVLISLAGDIASEFSSEKDREKMARWIWCYDSKVTDIIGYWAERAIEENRWNREETAIERTLFMVEDIMKLNMHLADTLSRSVASLNKCFHEDTWKLLNEACVVQLMLFNRRRIAEVGTVLLKSFRDKKKIDETSDVYKSLAKSEKLVCQRYFEIGVTGRLGKTVPVLMEENTADTVEFLLSLRREAGVPASNPYLFASGSTYFSGLKALNRFAKDCGAGNPKQLISRNVKGHLATVTQTLCLNDGERVRLTASIRPGPESNLENTASCVALHTAKLSKVLDALNKGVLDEYKGRSLEEIPVDSLLHQEEEQVGEPPNTSIDDAGLFNIAKLLCVVNKNLVHKYVGCSLDEIPASVLLSEGEEEQVLPHDRTDPPSSSKPSTASPKSPLPPKSLSNSSEPPTSPSKSPRPSMSPSNSSESWTCPSDSSEPPSPPLTSRRIGRRMPTPSKKFKRRWTTPEREIVDRHMKHHLDNKSLPSIPECRGLMAKYDVLKERTPVTIKAYINNTNNKNK